MDYGRLLFLAFILVYFIKRFIKNKKLNNLILSLIALLGLTTGKFLLKPYREPIQNNYFLTILSLFIFLTIIALGIYNIYHTRKLKIK